MVDKKTHYANDAGVPLLREIIAEHENELRGSNLHPYDNLVVSNGGTNAIYSFSRAILDPGDEVILLDPVWIAFIQITRLLRCKVNFVPTKHENHFIPSIEDLEKAVTPKTKVVVVVSPGNPTGAIFQEEGMRKILNFCEKHNLWLLHDEAYRDIMFGDYTQASFSGLHPNAVGVRTLSKSHNMTGFRVGWILSENKELINRVRKNIAYNVMCVNTMAQHAAIAALTQCKGWLSNNVDGYYQNLIYARNKLTELDFDVHWPRGSFYLFPKHHYGRPIAEEILNQEKVAVVDGHHFGNCGKDHFRISCSVSSDVLKNGLAGIERWVKSNE